MRTAPLDSISEGFVAYFDILGYREMTKDAKNLSQIVETIGKTRQVIKKATEKAERNFQGEKPTRIKSVFFGDSIVLFFHGDESVGWYVLPYCRGIFERMFRIGMPVRGAIAKGSFCESDGIYAGPPLNEAVKLSERLEFAGCVLAPSAEVWHKQEVAMLHEFDTEADGFKLLSVPLKPSAGEWAKIYVLTHGLDVGSEAVRTAFESHGKAIKGSVTSKLNNTIQVLQGARKK